MLFIYHIAAALAVGMLISVCLTSGLVLAQFCDLDHYGKKGDVAKLWKAVKMTKRSQVHAEFGTEMPFDRGFWHTKKGYFTAFGIGCLGVVLIGFALGMQLHWMGDGWWWTPIT